MSISGAFQSANAGLRANALQAEIISENVANASNASFTRRTVDLTTNSEGNVQIKGVSRAVDPLLSRLDRANTATTSAQSTVVDGLSAYTSYLGTTSDAGSPAALLNTLQATILAMRNAPSDASGQASAVNAATSLANRLNTLASTVRTVGDEVERNITYDVADANETLYAIAQTNKQLLYITGNGDDVATLQNRLDELTDNLSQYMDVQVVTGQNGIYSIYTGGGTELVTGGDVQDLSYNAATGTLTAGRTDITPGKGGGSISTGSLSGLFSLKTQDLPTIESQLDSMSAALIVSFQNASAFGANGTGLFTNAGAAFDPTASVSGLASRISVNAAVDPEKGGDPSLLQTGGATGIDSGDTSVIDALLAAFTAPTTVTSNGLGDGKSVNDLMTSLITLQQGMQAQAQSSLATTQANAATVAASRSNVQGVNSDEEMTNLLAVQQNYGANAKVLSSLTTMLDDLLNAV